MMFGSSWPPQLVLEAVPTHCEYMAQVKTPGVCLGRYVSVSFSS